MKIIFVHNLAKVPQIRFYPTGVMSLYGRNSIK